MNIVGSRTRITVALFALCISAFVVFNFIPKTEAENGAALPPATAMKNVIEVPSGSTQTSSMRPRFGGSTSSMNVARPTAIPMRQPPDSAINTQVDSSLIWSRMREGRAFRAEALIGSYAGFDRIK
jgi:hypothetical protein